MSKHLSSRQIKGLNKLGNALIPGDDEFPRFSKTGCVSEVDRLLDYMPAQDLSDLKMLLTIFGWIPGFVVAWIMKILEFFYNLNLLLPILRLIRIGVRGLVMSLYYSGGEPLEKLDYKVQVYLEDMQ